MRAGLVDEGQEGSAEDGQDLRAGAAVLAGAVHAPLGVAFPVVFVFDAPVAADDFQEPPRAGGAGIEAGQEVTHALDGRRGVSPGALAGAGDAHDGAGEGQADALGFYGDDAHFVPGDSSVGFAGEAKRGGRSGEQAAGVGVRALLVVLEAHEVVGPMPGDDRVQGGVLAVQGVGGDDGSAQVHVGAREQGARGALFVAVARCHGRRPRAGPACRRGRCQSPGRGLRAGRCGWC